MRKRNGKKLNPMKQQQNGYQKAFNNEESEQMMDLEDIGSAFSEAKKKSANSVRCWL